MRALIAVCAAVLLAGCQSYFDEQQAAIDRQNAERDHAWCQSVGIDKADQRYAVCRAYAADLRMRGAAASDAKMLGLLGLSVGAAASAQPSGVTTTCQPLGSGVSCQSY